MKPPPEILPSARRWAGRVLDWLYPPSCALCNTPLHQGRSLCETCAANLPRLAEPFCQQCSEPFPGQIGEPFACPNCSNIRFAYRFARSSLIRDPATLDLIHRLKYAREIHLAAELARFSAEAFDADPRLDSARRQGWPLVPVPLHRKRQHHRFFNQAREIALPLSRITGLPLLDALVRLQPTRTQTALSRAERLTNLRHAFATTPQANQWITAGRPRGAILVDDVLTTGATASACARILKQAGFREVCMVTVMRG